MQILIQRLRHDQLYHEMFLASTAEQFQQVPFLTSPMTYTHRRIPDPGILGSVTLAQRQTEGSGWGRWPPLPLSWDLVATHFAFCAKNAGYLKRVQNWRQRWLSDKQNCSAASGSDPISPICSPICIILHPSLPYPLSTLPVHTLRTHTPTWGILQQAEGTSVLTFTWCKYYWFAYDNYTGWHCLAVFAYWLRCQSTAIH